MNFLLLPRVLAGATVDICLAVLIGFLLAIFWVREEAVFAGSPPCLNSRRLRLPAFVLLLALTAQIFLLTASFTGETAWRKVLAAMPDVLSTHPGRVAEITAVAGLLFLCFTLLRLKPAIQLSGAGLLLAVVLALRSATGHAAVDGDFTLAELLQFLHLGSMAMWSGGILISGLIALPALVSHKNGGYAVPRYMSLLSLVSTWAVVTVGLTGVVKGWRAVGGDVRLLGTDTWGYLLIVKVAFVAVAVVLGGINRLRLREPAPWTEEANRRCARVLRFEAWIMLVVLVLSAWLSNMSPPGE